MVRTRQGILGKADKLLVEIKKLSILLKNYPQGTEKARMKKLMVKRCESLISLGGGDRHWNDTALEDLIVDKEVWEAIQDSHDISQFKKLVGVERFSELLKA